MPNIFRFLHVLTIYRTYIRHTKEEDVKRPFLIERSNR